MLIARLAFLINASVVMNDETPDERRSTLKHKCYINPSDDVFCSIFSSIFTNYIFFKG